MRPSTSSATLLALGSLVLAQHGAQAMESTDGAAPSIERDRPNIVLVLADDWSYPHAGIYGDPVARTPHFDELAKRGVLFDNAYCSSPTCTPSRASILTGRYIHELESGANLFGTLPAKFETYPDLLEEAGYHVGYEQKGWGPGYLEDRDRNPAGPQYGDFAQFLDARPDDAPFCYWLGSTAPHRAYVYGSGLADRFSMEDLVVPPFLPDREEVRMDLLDYYDQVEKFDDQLGGLLDRLEAIGELEDTLIVVTSDNGMPFIRSKANLYDAGSRMPMVVFWPDKVEANTRTDTFVSLVDLAPTFLDAAGLDPRDTMTGRSLLPFLAGRTATHREQAFIERERHANMRAGNLSYPARALRNDEYLFIWNMKPERWPAGDPEVVHGMARDAPWGDVDDSPTRWLMRIMHNHCDDPEIERLWELAFAKRPEFELYDLKRDPDQLANVAGDPQYAETRERLLAELEAWMRDTDDPRLDGQAGERFDRYPYYGPMVGIPGMKGAGSPNLRATP